MKKTVDKNYIFALITVFVWATTAPVLKLLSADMPNMQTLAVGSVFAFLFLLVLNIAKGDLKKFKTYSLKEYGIMCGLGFIGIF